MSNTFLLPGAIAGLLSGIASILLAMADPGYATAEIAGFAILAIAAAGAQFASLRLAGKDMPQLAAFPPRYFLAMLAGATTAALHALACWLHFAVIDPGYLQGFYLDYLERAQAAAASPAQAQQLLARAETMKDFITDPFSQAMSEFGAALMIALLTGLAAAALPITARRQQ